MWACSRQFSLSYPPRESLVRWPTTYRVLDRLEQPSFSLALAALLHAVASPAVSYEICRRWKLSNRDSQQVRWLVEHHDALVAARQMAWPRLQRLLISDGIDELLQLHEAIAMAAGNDSTPSNYCRELLAMPPTSSIRRRC